VHLGLAVVVVADLAAPLPFWTAGVVMAIADVLDAAAHEDLIGRSPAVFFKIVDSVDGLS
jgi:hypothetical protein